MKSNLVSDQLQTNEGSVVPQGQDDLTLQISISRSNVPETDNGSHLRASDLNMMTEGVDDKDQSPQIQEQLQILSRNAAGSQVLRNFDSSQSGVVLIQKQATILQPRDLSLTLIGHHKQPSDVQFTDSCRRELGIGSLNMEEDSIKLRLKGKQQQNSKSSAGGPVHSNMHSIKKSDVHDKENITTLAHGLKQSPAILSTRQAQSVDPQLRSNGASAEKEPAAGAPRLIGRCLGAGTSQPPIQQIAHSTEPLQFNMANQWRSPMKTTAFTPGIFSSHLKLNRQLNSNQKSNYKDYQREMYQQRSVQLEGELHEAQTTLRKKEGSHRIQIALLEQQVTQMRQEMSEAKRREEKQKSTYDQILAIINQQLKNANMSQPSYNAILINLNQVQNILHSANKTFRESRVTSYRADTDPTSPDASPLPYMATGRPADPPGAAGRQSSTFSSQLQEKNNIIQNYEKQSRQILEEMAQLQLQLQNEQRKTAANEVSKLQLEERIEKLEAELDEQKEREQKLKSLHNDEMKYNADMNEYEQQLFQSKIRELESNIATMQNRMQLWNVTESSVGGNSQVCPGYGSQIIADDRSPRLQMVNRSARLHSQTKAGLIKKTRYSTNGVAGFPDSNGSLQAPQIISAGSIVTVRSHQVHDKECQTDESILQQSMSNMLTTLKNEKQSLIQEKEDENETIRERMCQMQDEREEEMQLWQGKQVELENTITKLKKHMNQHLTNHKEATDMLKSQLKHAQTTTKHTEAENKALKSKLQQIKQQIIKLERIQQGELSRSRSGSRHANGFMFGHGRTVDSRKGGIESRYHQSCVSSLSPHGTAEKKKQSAKAATMLKRHSKTPAAFLQAQKKNGPSRSIESVGSIMQNNTRRPNPKQNLFGSLHLRQRVEGMNRNDPTANSMTIQECLKPADSQSQRGIILSLKQQLGILRKSAEMVSRSRSKSSQYAGAGNHRFRDHDARASCANIEMITGQKSHNKPDNMLTCRKSYLSNEQSTLGERSDVAQKSKLVSKLIPIISKENMVEISKPNEDQDVQRSGKSCPPSNEKAKKQQQIVKTTRVHKVPVSRNDIATGRGQIVFSSHNAVVKKPTSSEKKNIISKTVQKSRLVRDTSDDGMSDRRLGSKKSSDILCDRQRIIKPTLKARSSSKINTVKKELVKRLQALQSNDKGSSQMSLWAAPKDTNFLSDQKQENGFRGSKNRAEEGRKGGSVASGPNARAVIAETISNPRNSHLNFNLQRIANDIKEKDCPPSKRQSALNSRFTSAQRRGNHHQKSSADFAMSGDFCEWGLSPEGVGTSVNRQMLEGYRFKYNQLFASMQQKREQNGLSAVNEASKSQKGEESANDHDSKPVYFGDVSPNKKFITKLRDARKNGSNIGVPSAANNRTEGSLNRRIVQHRTECSINPLLTYDNNATSIDRRGTRPSHVDKVNRILTQILSQVPPDSQQYNTQPRIHSGSNTVESSMSDKYVDDVDDDELEKADTCRQVVEQLEPGGLSTDRAMDIPCEFTYMNQRDFDDIRSEVNKPQGELLGSEESSSHISPVKQEAAKAVIKDMRKGSPALETRRVRDQNMIGTCLYSCRTKSVESKVSRGESAKTGKSRPLQPQQLQQQALKNGRCTDLNQDCHRRAAVMSSSNSDTSMGSNQKREDRNVVIRALLEGAPASATGAKSKKDYHALQPTSPSANDSLTDSPTGSPRGELANNDSNDYLVQQLYKLLENRNTGDNITYDHCNEILLATPAILNRFEEMSSKIVKRDHKVYRLKMRGRDLKRRLEKLEQQYQELSERFEGVQKQKDELQLVNQKFECRLKQAQIILNDPTDRVELQFNLTSECEGQTFEERLDFEAQETGRGEVKQEFSELDTKLPSRREHNPHAAKNSISSSIKEIQMKKQQIRLVESRQRSLKNNLISMQGSCSRNSDHQALNHNAHHLYTQQIQPSLYTQQYQDQTGSFDRKHTQSVFTQTQSAQVDHGKHQAAPKAQEDQKSLFNFFIKRANSLNSTSNQINFKNKIKNQPSISKEVAASPVTCVPKIDLSCLKAQPEQDLGSARCDLHEVLNQNIFNYDNKLSNQKLHEQSNHLPLAFSSNATRNPKLDAHSGLFYANRTETTQTLSRLLHGGARVNKSGANWEFSKDAMRQSNNYQENSNARQQSGKEQHERVTPRGGPEIRVAPRRELNATALGSQVQQANEIIRQEMNNNKEQAFDSPSQSQMLGQRGFEAARTAVQTSRLLEAVERIALDRSSSAMQAGNRQLLTRTHVQPASGGGHLHPTDNNNCSTHEVQWRPQSEMGSASMLMQTAKQMARKQMESAVGARTQRKLCIEGIDANQTQLRLNSKSNASTQLTQKTGAQSKKSVQNRESKLSSSKAAPFKKPTTTTAKSTNLLLQKAHVMTKSNESLMSSCHAFPQTNSRPSNPPFTQQNLTHLSRPTRNLAMTVCSPLGFQGTAGGQTSFLASAPGGNPNVLASSAANADRKKDLHSTTAQHAQQQQQIVFSQVTNRKKPGLSKKLMNRVVMEAMEAREGSRPAGNSGSEYFKNIQNPQLGWTTLKKMPQTSKNATVKSMFR